MVNILVIDDDADLCRMLSRFLEKNGCKVFSAGDALQGLDVLGREQVDMVITDFMMPHMDGIRLTEQLRSDQRFRELPVILISAHCTDELTDRGLRTGVAMTLSKPIDFEKLLTLVRFAE